MDESTEKKGKMLYVRGRNLSLLEQYARDNKLGPSEALNEIIADHFRAKSTDDDAPITKRDMAMLVKKLELINIILEPALLDLLEVSGHVRSISQNVPNADKLGRTIKERYSSFFKEIKDMV